MTRLLMHTLILVGVVSLASAQETNETSPQTLDKIVKLKESVCIKLEELLKFKDEAEFKQFGFGRGGPYYKWLDGVQELRAATPKGPSSPIPFKLRVTPGELMQIGMDYMQKGKETDYINQILPELKTTIDYDGFLQRKQAKKYLDLANKQRTWTDESGKFTVVATLTRFENGKLTLSKKSGGTVTLPIQKLSKSDRELLEKAYPESDAK